jgi:predicted transcriptional regulator
MEGLGELLFDLSSTDRVTLLREIDKERLRQSQLAERLSATVQETSRHLLRLSQASLIGKDPEGLYFLTGYGKAILRLVPPMDFLSRHRKYFVSHDVTSLPPSFLERIGELSESAYAEKLGGVLDHIQSVISEAKEFVWLMADQILTIDSDSQRRLLERKVSVRAIIPVKEFGSRQPSGNLTMPENMEMRFADEVRAGIAMNESLAGVVFPELTGKIDFSCGFGGTSQGFHGWCRDLFLYHWEYAKKLKLTRSGYVNT